MKRKINKSEFDKLSDELKKLYKPVEGKDDEFRLELEDDEDNGALKRGLDREKQKRKEAEAELEKLRADAEDAEALNARKKGDIDTLEKSWKAKLDDAKSKSETRIKSLESNLTKLLVDNVALTIASKIATKGNEKVLLPHIKARLTAEFEQKEGQELEARTRVLDAAGKPSALTPDELGAEFVANADFAAIVVGSKASGSAGKLPQRDSAAPGQSPFKAHQAESVDFSRMHPSNLAQALKANKEASQT